MQSEIEYIPSKRFNPFILYEGHLYVKKSTLTGNQWRCRNNKKGCYVGLSLLDKNTMLTPPDSLSHKSGCEPVYKGELKKLKLYDLCKKKAQQEPDMSIRAIYNAGKREMFSDENFNLTEDNAQHVPDIKNVFSICYRERNKSFPNTNIKNTDQIKRKNTIIIDKQLIINNCSY
jgi:hypothetical protein